MLLRSPSPLTRPWPLSVLAVRLALTCVTNTAMEWPLRASSSRKQGHFPMAAIGLLALSHRRHEWQHSTSKAEVRSTVVEFTPMTQDSHSDPPTKRSENGRKRIFECASKQMHQVGSEFWCRVCRSSPLSCRRTWRISASELGHPPSRVHQGRIDPEASPDQAPDGDCTARGGNALSSVSSGRSEVGRSSRLPESYWALPLRSDPGKILSPTRRSADDSFGGMKGPVTPISPSQSS
jgi:hypothetical protein